MVFSTHISDSSLDPVISDLPEALITCRPLSTVGSSDHFAVLSVISICTRRDSPLTPTNWIWGSADWEGHGALQRTPCPSILTGGVDEQIHAFTETLLSHKKNMLLVIPTQSNLATSRGLVATAE